MHMRAWGSHEHSTINTEEINGQYPNSHHPSFFTLYPTPSMFKNTVKASSNHLHLIKINMFECMFHLYLRAYLYNCKKKKAY